MKPTRPQRRRLAWLTFIVGTIAVTFMIWNQRMYLWTTAPGGGTVVREFGLYRYLTITSKVTGPFGASAQQSVTSSDWHWQLGGVAINGAITLALAGTLGWWCRRMIRRDRLVGCCDECGYDLTGLRSQACPECGAAVDQGAGARG